MVLPRLARVITLWEFLLMKVEKGRPSRPHIADVLNEYEVLNKQVGKMCGDYLVPMDESGRTPIEKHRNILQVIFIVPFEYKIMNHIEKFPQFCVLESSSS